MRSLDRRLAALEAVEARPVVAVQLVDADGTHTRLDRVTFERRYPHVLIVDYVYVDQWDLL